jgi:hypothetical protein
VVEILPKECCDLGLYPRIEEKKSGKEKRRCLYYLCRKGSGVVKTTAKKANLVNCQK